MVGLEKTTTSSREMGSGGVKSAGILVMEERFYTSMEHYMDSIKSNSGTVLKTRILHGVVLSHSAKPATKRIHLITGGDEGEPEQKRIKSGDEGTGKEIVLKVSDDDDRAHAQHLLGLRLPCLPPPPLSPASTTGTTKAEPTTPASTTPEMMKPSREIVALVQNLTKVELELPPGSEMVCQKNFAKVEEEEEEEVKQRVHVIHRARQRSHQHHQMIQTQYKDVKCIFCGNSTRFEDFNNGKAEQPRFRCLSCKERFTLGGKLRGYRKLKLQQQRQLVS